MIHFSFILFLCKKPTSMKFIFALILLTTSSIGSLAASPVYSNAYGKKSDPAVIFIHGGPGYNCYSFELSTAQKLADRGFYVIVYDQRGCGRSGKDSSAKFTREESSADLLSVFEKYELKQ